MEGGTPAGAAPLERENIASMTVAELWRRGQVGWPRRFPVVQFPNPPLLLALTARAAAGIGDPDGKAASAGRSLFVAGIGLWALEELTDGANWWRRLLGVAGLACVVHRVHGAFAAATLNDGPAPRLVCATVLSASDKASP